jgi:hypothetical protein
MVTDLVFLFAFDYQVLIDVFPEQIKTGHVIESGIYLQLAMVLLTMKWNEIICEIGSKLQFIYWKVPLIGDIPAPFTTTSWFAKPDVSYW